jgi:hypothetical protein
MIKRLGILRGGRSEYFEPSIKEGGKILSFVQKNLSDKYKPVDILIDGEGVWHISGVPVLPGELMHRVDLVWNTSHPEHADTLKNFSVPHFSAPRSGHAIRESREMLREHMKRLDINLPRHFVIPAYQEDFDGDIEKYSYRKATEVFEKFGSPWVVRSYPPEGSMGVHVARTFGELARAIMDGAEHKASLEVEELISHRSVGLHAVSGFRGHDVYIIPEDKMSAQEKETLSDLTKKLCELLGAEHYLYSSFYLHPKRGIFLKDLELMPDTSEESNFHKASELIGVPARTIIEHLLERVSK